MLSGYLIGMDSRFFKGRDRNKAFLPQQLFACKSVFNYHRNFQLGEMRSKDKKKS